MQCKRLGEGETSSPSHPRWTHRQGGPVGQDTRTGALGARAVPRLFGSLGEALLPGAWREGRERCEAAPAEVGHSPRERCGIPRRQ
jgi:hypothetical protein